MKNMNKIPFMTSKKLIDLLLHFIDRFQSWLKKNVQKEDDKKMWNTSNEVNALSMMSG